MYWALFNGFSHFITRRSNVLARGMPCRHTKSPFYTFRRRLKHGLWFKFTTQLMNVNWKILVIHFKWTYAGACGRVQAHPSAPPPPHSPWAWYCCPVAFEVWMFRVFRLSQISAQLSQLFNYYQIRQQKIAATNFPQIMNSPWIYLNVNFTPEISLSKINIKIKLLKIGLWKI